ncbi:MAG: AAA family ATPase [Nanoarchaeota archaeon]
MKINKIKLENIRSYLNQEINFSDGYTLLAGEIGSGKSTILLAIEFALFGFGSNVTGGSLLRNGENKGSVELDLDIDDKNIIIKRNLKKHGASISQDAGFIIIDGKRFDGSAIELKDSILNLLNYPKDFLTKSKGLIYKYTVYTPQEEMKSILLGNEEIRLETLRKVFGVDKYKRIKDNSRVLIQDIKVNRKELAGKIADLDEKVNKKREIKNEINKINENVFSLEGNVKEIKKEFELIENKIKNSEESLNKLKDLKKQREFKEFELEQINNLIKKNSLQIERLNNEIRIIEEDIEKNKIVIDKDDVFQKEKKFDQLKEEVSELNSLLGGLRNKIMSSEDIKEKISKLDMCPLCKQKVTLAHIKEVINEENEKIKISNMKIKENEKILENKKTEILSLQKEIDKFKEKVAKLESLALKEKLVIEKREHKDSLEKENKQSKNKLDDLIKLINNLGKEVLNYDEKEKTHKEFLLERKKTDEKHRKLEIELSSLNSTIKSLYKQMDEIENEIKLKGVDKEKLLYLTRIQNWLEEKFVNLMDLIERKILFRIHNDFNLLFQKWFSMLIDSDIMNVNLDESFTPVIEQNGHIIDYYYLSGGEKTAAALAYRLALNQVINNLISIIKTKDLLVLDEPTDGFSSSQLDLMKNVLDELNMNQVILVSHDSKIESFVDRVIRIRKNEHVSEVI